MMIEQDDKDRKTEVTKERQIGNSDDQPRSMGIVEDSRLELGHDQIGISGEDSQRGNSDELDNSNGERLAGKILRELRELRKAHLEYVQAHEQRLEQRLSENRQYQSEVVSRMNYLEQEIIRLLEEQENHLQQPSV
jgi:hypothetical protein